MAQVLSGEGPELDRPKKAGSMGPEIRSAALNYYLETGVC